MRKAAASIIIVIAIGFSNTVAALDDWTSSVVGVRTCKHPTTGATLIQIDFSNSKSLVLADNDYPSLLFTSYLSIALSAYVRNKQLSIHNANAYAYNYCNKLSTHSAGPVHLYIHD